MTSVEILSELRSGYNFFDPDEMPYYQALSDAIQAIQLIKRIYVVIEDSGWIDRKENE